jgi:hypothetical protein
MIKYSHNEIHEQASETVERRNDAVEVNESEFIKILGDKKWLRFKAECCGANNEVTGFYRSTYKGEICYFVEAGNIDRVFI